MKQEKGITLIALVITIVVLVILVGVTVHTMMNSGLIPNAKTAVGAYDKEQKREAEEINLLNRYTSDKKSTLRKPDSINTYFNSGIGEDEIESIEFRAYTSLELPENAVNQFDASEAQDGTIIGYYMDKDNNGLYELSFVSEGMILANQDSSFLFWPLENLIKIDLKDLDTSNVTNMSNMFGECYRLQEVDFSNFNTSNVTNMSEMFWRCSKLTNLDLSSFNTSNVIYMNGMFMDCGKLSVLDLSNFDTSNVVTMNEMFGYCYKLTTIHVKNFEATTNKGWEINKVANSEKMFIDCKSLVGQNGTVYNENSLDKTYARIDKEGEPGYLSDVSSK